MPIIVSCPSCSGQLRVSDDLIGRMVRCPACHTTFESKEPAAAPRPPRVVDPPVETETVPVWRDLNLELHEDKPTSAASDDPPLERTSDLPLKGAVEVDVGDDAPARPSTPTPEPEEPRSGKGEAGRSRAKLSDDHDDLQPCPACGKMIHRDARRCYSCGERFETGSATERDRVRPSRQDEEDEDNPPRRRRRARRDTEPHRGGFVLTFGILSLATLFVCWPLAPIAFVFGIVAWVMGHRDLNKIRDGSMDPEGEDTTKAGWICAIIGVFLNLLVVLGCGGVFGLIWYEDMQRARQMQQQRTPPRVMPPPRF